MSGTGQMKESERGSAPAASNAEPSGRGEDAPVSRTAHVEREAAAAIAELSTGSLLDALEPTRSNPPAAIPAAIAPRSTPPATKPEPTPEPEPAPTPEPTETGGERLSHDFGALATSVTEAFKDFSIGNGEWYVELSAPHGVSSSSAGKREPTGPALQHLRLRPRRRREGTSTIVAGTVNPVDNRAELRDYDHVAIAHEVRYRQPFQIKVDEWEQLLRKAERVLNSADIQSLRTPPTRDLLEQRRNLQRISKGAITVLVVVLILATVVAWRVVVALVMR